MKLNHNNICTKDVAFLRSIFTQHFGFETVREGEYRGSPFAFMRGMDGFVLVLTTIGPDSTQVYPTGFHVGFTVGSPDEVHAKHRELSGAGLQPNPINSFEALGEQWTAFYCPVGDGMAIEVNAHT